MVGKWLFKSSASQLGKSQDASRSLTLRPALSQELPPLLRNLVFSQHCAAFSKSVLLGLQQLNSGFWDRCKWRNIEFVKEPARSFKLTSSGFASLCRNLTPPGWGGQSQMGAVRHHQHLRFVAFWRWNKMLDLWLCQVRHSKYMQILQFS